MNLATRCPSCGTVFRVGQDHLQASEGWVRCGRCNGVFNATEVLFDTETGEPVLLPPARSADTGLPQAPAAAPASSIERAGAAWAAPRIEPGPDEADARPAPHQAFAHAASPPPARSAFADEPLLRSPSRHVDDDEPIVITDHVRHPAPLGAEPGQAAPGIDLAEPAPPGPVSPGGDGLPLGLPAGMPPLQAPATPSFMRAADRAAVWRRPAVRAGLVVGVLLLALGALLQMALLWRDTLAAHLPEAAPLLQALCRPVGCSVQPLRRIESLAVDSSGLNRLDGAPLYRLQMVLHNRASTAVMMPALDLTLTDKQGQLVARRVLSAGELGLPQAALQAGQEVPIKVLVSTGERRVDGYTLELFYP